MSERNVLTAYLELRTGLTSEEKLAVSRELWNVLIPHLAPEGEQSMGWRRPDGGCDVTDLIRL